MNSSRELTEGDFESLFREEHRRVVAFLYLRIGAAAQDVAADAFARAWSARRSYDPERGPLRTWLWAIVRNAAVDWQRQSRPTVDLARPALSLASSRPSLPAPSGS